MRRSLLKVSLTLLAALSWVSAGLVFETRPAPVEPVQGGTLSALVRLPASLPGALPGVFAAPVRIEAPRMEQLKVPCWDAEEKSTLATEARWVRMSGKACARAGTADSIQVRNLANGYVATVFSTQGDRLTTDYIPVESGKNEILVRFNQGEGVTFENRITLQR